MRERFGASDASGRLRFHTQTGGVTLHGAAAAQQRRARRRSRRSPRCWAARSRCTRTATTRRSRCRRRSGDARAAHAADRRARIGRRRCTVDPLAGSYYVEHLTDELERAARSDLIGEVDALGGAAKAIAASILSGGDRAQRVRAPAARRARRDRDRRREQVHRTRIATPAFRSPDYSRARAGAGRAAAARRARRTRDAGDAANERSRSAPTLPARRTW